MPFGLALAFQGFGSHSAFTWGVAHALLEEKLPIRAISGSSGGAFNAVFAASGLCDGDHEKAISELARGWKGFSDLSKGSPFQSGWVERTTGTWPNLTNSGYNFFRWMAENMKERDINPSRRNHILEFLKTSIDFDAIRESSRLSLFINAFDPLTMENVIFTNGSITAPVVAASCNLPEIMPPVHVEGRQLWDGGYASNPCAWPLFRAPGVTDVLFVQLIPSWHSSIPEDGGGILQRKIEGYHTARAHADFEKAAMINHLIAERALDTTKTHHRTVHLHRIEKPEQKNFGLSSLDNLDPEFLKFQHDLGYRVGREWLDTHGVQLGIQGTWDPVSAGAGCSVFLPGGYNP